MIFWLAAAVLTGLVAVALVPPLTGRALTGRARSRAAARAPALSVYKAQLAELARDRERGVVTETEATALQVEIERRMLKASEASEAEASAWRARPPGVIAAALLVPAAALALYFVLGRPGLPGRAPVTADAQYSAQADPQAAEVADLVAELERRMAERPDDPVGWRLLGHAQASLGRWADSAASYARAVAAGGGDAQTLAAWGEALVFAAGGTVSPPAEEVLRRALAADPREPRARYYQGLARLQAGEPQAALALWRGLAAQTPADAPWAGFLEDRIRLAEAMAVPKGPSAEDFTAVAELPPEEQEAAIRGMVERLADRLERKPDDLEGWLRLANAYEVLGEADRRRGALERAAALAPDRVDLQLALADAEAAGGSPEAGVRRLDLLLQGLPPNAPERPAVEAELNRLRDRE
ncbi:MAG: c-type cytochrome biogenesis protein CcmI [Rhodospirillales bacterium]|nr:c-type cytochrome biogenesis protein CcmI [Rhodospirillales bacterium]